MSYECECGVEVQKPNGDKCSKCGAEPCVECVSIKMMCGECKFYNGLAIMHNCDCLDECPVCGKLICKGCSKECATKAHKTPCRKEPGFRNRRICLGCFKSNDICRMCYIYQPINDGKKRTCRSSCVMTHNYPPHTFTTTAYRCYWCEGVSCEKHMDLNSPCDGGGFQCWTCYKAQQGS